MNAQGLGIYRVRCSRGRNETFGSGKGTRLIRCLGGGGRGEEMIRRKLMARQPGKRVRRGCEGVTKSLMGKLGGGLELEGRSNATCTDSRRSG